MLDALDECPEKADHVKRRELLGLLKRLHSYGHGNMHILATSRGEKDISRSLEGIAAHRIRVEDSFHHDIQLLVRKRLEDEKLARWGPQLKMEIATRILQVDEP